MTETICNQSSYNSILTRIKEDMSSNDTGQISYEKDVEKFDGKILYNPDGSAIIIDKASDEEDSSQTKLDGVLLDEISDNVPLIDSTVYVQRKHPEFSSPIVHNYRVINLKNDKVKNVFNESGVPLKPILMCFVCKLSFGFCQSFVTHAVSEHGVELSDDEKELLSRKNASALLQTFGKEKETIVSFLEPLVHKDEEEEEEEENYSLKQDVSSKNTHLDNDPRDFSLLSMRNSFFHRVNGSSSPRSPSSPSSSFLSTNANMLAGTTIGACPEHINGRTTGLECAKCDIILKASQLPGGLAWNAARNSCKTLKCPKCNWHYKYQETLDIHMKEKHPENETTCIYCLTGQAHPRLARGETYNCGYKPYRCEVCNYSTTTKGNLSIHMQSDKHLNNMQELQNGSGIPGSGSTSSELGSKIMASSSSGSPCLLKQSKPSWRCDVCNYETNVARNLRIHMTSEKHTHNILVLQQNAKQTFAPCGSNGLLGNPSSSSHLEHFFQLQLAAAAAAASAGTTNFSSNLSAFSGNNTTNTNNNTNTITLNNNHNNNNNINASTSGEKPETAMADLAYFQALMMQFMSNGSFPPCPLPSSSPLGGSDGESLEAPPEPLEPNPKHLFSCCVCYNFGTESLEILSGHLTVDRTKVREHEVSLIMGGHYICKLCSYKTNLKANFQLHCKTDKHLQRLNHINHIKEGGSSNEWKLKFLNVSNPVQIRCNACDYFTNSLHKLQLHVSNTRHDNSSYLFAFLKNSEKSFPEGSTLYICSLCSFEASGKTALLSHVRSLKHLQMEQIHTLRKRASEEPERTEISDIFKVIEASSSLLESTTESITEDREIESQNELNLSRLLEGSRIPCPLCHEPFSDYGELEAHVSLAHAVNAEGLQKLLLLIGLPSIPGTETEVGKKGSSEAFEDVQGSDLNDKKLSRRGLVSSLDKYLDPNRPYKCEVCKESFTQKNILLVHYNSVSHLHKLKKSIIEGKQLCLGDESHDEEERGKPYKCNICRVAYGQGSTLEIHIRSVLHQSRASKLQELALSGQIDLSKPLLEQPNDSETKTFVELLSPKSLNSTGNSSPGSSPLALASVAAASGNNTLQSPGTNAQKSLLNELLASSSSTSSEHQSHLSKLFHSFPSAPNGDSSKLSFQEKSHSVVLKNLLQNYGFELVMQFNEYHQRRRQKEEEDRRRLEEEKQGCSINIQSSSPHSSFANNLINNHSNINTNNNNNNKNNINNHNNNNNNNNNNNFSLPEMKKSKCPICDKEFSSIWVLKAHSEEIHKDAVPSEFLEKFVQEFKYNLEKKEGEEEEDFKSSTFLTPEKSFDEGDKSTPKSKETSPFLERPSSRQTPNISEMQQAFQQAFFQQHQPPSAPPLNNMMLHMAQLSGLNPLAAMNLHPPLIPPAMLLGKKTGNPNSNNYETTNDSSSLFSKLGIDTKMLLKSGLDPNFLLQLGQVEQSNLVHNADESKYKAESSNKNENISSSISSPRPELKELYKHRSFEPKLSQSEVSTLEQSSSSSFTSELITNSKTSVLMFQQPSEQQKRARTRITDDQLKVLRSNFDINNSPSEAATVTMSQQTGLPAKVIKHWFRNTLFKERQRNKDSPYNFNNPPSTLLNLEEYEKTGESKVISLSEEDRETIMEEEQDRPVSVMESNADNEEFKIIKNESGISDEIVDSGGQRSQNSHSPSSLSSPNNSSISLSSLLTSQIAVSQSGTNNYLPLHHGLSSSLSGCLPDFFNPMHSSDKRSRSPASNSSQNQGKRANRTRFTDYQIKVLQEFFENNAYPKDDDLEYLSKLLGLSPRVIVVWFQNARQKARKIYENQPPIDPTDDGAGRFTRTPGLNYQCKKCLLVFQRYYELIRHQKQHCFKEEDAKRSAQAQKAAANAAAQFSNSPGAFQSSTPHSEDSNSSLCGERGEIESPLFNQSNSSLPPPETNRRSFDVSEEWHSGPSDNSSFPQIFRTKREDEETRKITPSMFDQLIREDPFSKFINPLGSGPSCFPNYPHSSPFGLLQQPQPQSGSSMTAMVRDGVDSYDDLDNESLGSSPSSCKRKLSEDGDCDDKDEGGAHRDKRLRTTILPEQLDFLYQKYQIESNPSRKMLEQIANEVGLRKRVVQVWFQNTRARERKGQFRAHQQVINKRCPYCPALFKVRSALESHLSSKHNDQNHKGEINIDALPDVEGFHEDGESGRNIVLTPNSCVSGLTPGTSELEESMRKYYEDTMKRYMNDLANHQDSVSSPSLSSLRESGQKAALDLSDSPALDLTKSCNEENGFWDKEARSDVISLGDNQSCDFEEDEEDQSGDENKQGSFLNKRYRTQMSSLQIKMIKSVFSFYKTPNMAECSALGREIGLPKRVVQVWFQNARAKEKKAKLHFVQIVGNEERQENEFDEEDEQNIFPSECKLCNFQISADSISFPEHLFSKAHQDNVRRCISEGKYHPQSPGDAIAEATAAIAHIRSRNTLSCSSPSFSQISSSEKTSSGSREEIEKTLMQHLYGVGHGISSYPTGVATANPFLHPAMFSASGK